MTTVTIPGGNGTTIAFSVLGDASSNYAHDFANALFSEQNFTNLANGGPSTIAGALNYYQGGSQATLTFSLNTDGQYTFNASSTPDVIDIFASNETVVSGYDSTVNEEGTSGGNRVIFSTGTNLFNGSATGGTGDTLVGGSGQDTIYTGGGATTVFSGEGHNKIVLQDSGISGGDIAVVTGPSTVFAYGMNDTVDASGGGFVVGGTGALTFVATTDPTSGAAPPPVTVFGGSGTSTLFLIDGSNVTYTDGGTGSATVVAGAGNETLNAAGSASNLAVFGSDNGTGLTVTGGTGNDYFGTGAGSDMFSITGGSTDFLELNGLAGSSATISGLSGASTYAVNIAGLTVAQEQALANSGTSSGGNLSITLSNGSTVEFMGVTSTTLDSHFV